MNPERWRRIELLFHQAIEKESGERSAFLTEACGGDQEFRATLESLLRQEGSFIDRAASAGYTGVTQDAPHTVLAPGAAIGPYQIEGLLGSGGMGEGWKARDTRLNRPVAIKLLSAPAADDAARRRFQREAQSASSLNHPQILTVYDAGEWQREQYLVMEFAGEHWRIGSKLAAETGPMSSKRWQESPTASRPRTRPAFCTAISNRPTFY